MRILFLTFYFEPDLGAGSFRATALVKALSRQLSHNDTIHVVTTMPNRYHTYLVDAPSHETRGNIEIHRISMPGHHSGMVDQSVAFGYYAAGVVRCTGFKVHKPDYDIVFATSSRLMTAMMGALMARFLKARSYFDFRDIFADTLSNVVNRKYKWLFPMIKFIERKTVRQADRINLVSPGFIAYFKKIRDDIEYRTFTNGIDDNFLDTDYHPVDENRGGRIILYAGNIGNGQGLDHIVPAAAARLGSGWQFWIIGDGGARKVLERELERLGITNVTLINPVDQARLIDYYRRADVLFLHLNDYPAFEKVLPSKIFEYAATGKPLLAGVTGYSRDFIQTHIPNSAVFDPCDPASMIKSLGELTLKTDKPIEFTRKFRRSTIARTMAEDVIELMNR